MEVVHGIGGVVDLAENIIRAFKDPSLFEQTAIEYGDDGWYAYDTNLPFGDDIDKELINFNQFSNCNWDAIRYVECAADVKIQAGVKDSFGWLTGVITPNKKPEWANGKKVAIVYG